MAATQQMPRMKEVVIPMRRLSRWGHKKLRPTWVGLSAERVLFYSNTAYCIESKHRAINVPLPQ